MKLHAILLAAILAPALAHEGHHSEEESAGMAMAPQAMDMSNTTEPIAHVMKHMHGVPILQTELLPIEREFWELYNATNYFNYPTGNKHALAVYIIGFAAHFVIAAPLLMTIHNLNPLSLTHLFGLFVSSAIALASLAAYAIFKKSIPELYPGNVLGVFNWIYAISIPIQCVLAVFKTVYSRSNDQYDEVDSINSPMTLYDLSRNQLPNSFDLNEPHHDHDIEDLDITMHLKKLKANSFSSLYNKLAEFPVFSKLGKSSLVLYQLCSWFNFMFFFVYFPAALAVFGCIGQGNRVFNVLAHFIKGGVFFMYGLLSLVRYCGGFRNKGWAWNYKFIYNTRPLTWWERVQPQGLITMEWVECFLIFFYGSTNIFMEHLASPGGEWTPKDLEHVSIAFIFLGCGICGLITENKLSKWRYTYSNQDNKNVVKSAPGFSPNPFPILCIFWTGILMSQHQQASELSTKIHTQWGTLFVYGTAFRFISYVLGMLLPKPVDLTQPIKPMTELIVSFCLLAGGAIFMESCDPVVWALEYRGFDAMFTLNVALGLVFLLMAWIMAVFQFKSWYAKKYIL